MTTIDLNTLANQLFANWLEQHPECGKGEYLSAKTNYILAFDEFITSAPFSTVKEILPTLNAADFPRLKQYISAGVDAYLLENAKTLALI